MANLPDEADEKLSSAIYAEEAMEDTPLSDTLEQLPSYVTRGLLYLFLLFLVICPTNLGAQIGCPTIRGVPQLGSIGHTVEKFWKRYCPTIWVTYLTVTSRQRVDNQKKNDHLRSAIQILTTQCGVDPLSWIRDILSLRCQNI